MVSQNYMPVKVFVSQFKNSGYYLVNLFSICALSNMLKLMPSSFSFLITAFPGESCHFEVIIFHVTSFFSQALILVVLLV